MPASASRSGVTTRLNPVIEQRETRQTLAHVIESVLRALHPYAPFITEELWQRVPRPSARPVSVALAPYPSVKDGPLDAAAEAEFDSVMRVTGAARATRSEHEVPQGKQIPLHLRAAPELRALLESEVQLIQFLVKTDGPPSIEPSGGSRPRGAVLNVAGDVEVLVGLLGLVDAAHEATRIEREIKKIDKDIVGLAQRLQNPKFVEKAPPEVVTEAREQLEALQRQRVRLDEAKSLVIELQESQV
jgi:valyl-tRNA synthetase